MRKKLLLVFLATHLMNAQAQPDHWPGNDMVDGSRIDPYQFTWQQCSVGENGWQPAGSVTETLTLIGDQMVRIQRGMQSPQGIRQSASAYHVRANLAPRLLESQALDAKGALLGSATRQLDSEGYSGSVTRQGETQSVSGALNSQMLDGSALGLPLATLPYQDQPVRFLAMMMAFDASYDVVADWVGKEALHYDGQDHIIWLVDLTWTHREQGDVYPPGPEASGGRFWLLHDPPESLPHVLRYQTDSYAVEYLPGVCSTNPTP